MKIQLLLFLILISHGLMAHEVAQTWPSADDVIGLSEQQLVEKYPETQALDRSFHLLVSKHLHPYRIPSSHKLLRWGSAYLVFELNGDKVIAIHRISG